jgi:predicted nucleic acid-binding protein
MEVLLKPLRESALILVSDYEDFLAAQHWLTINDGTFNRALHLRAHHNLKTPDSIHLATALTHGCNEFWTNDDRLSKAAGIMAVNIFSD